MEYRLAASKSGTEWERFLTTNDLEHLIRKLRRRTRPVGAFVDKSGCDRLFYGVVRRVNRRWSPKTLPDFTRED